MNKIHVRVRSGDRNLKFSRPRNVRKHGSGSQTTLPGKKKAARLITNLEKPLTRKYLTRAALSCDMGIYPHSGSLLSIFGRFFRECCKCLFYRLLDSDFGRVKDRLRRRLSPVSPSPRPDARASGRRRRRISLRRICPPTEAGASNGHPPTSGHRECPRTGTRPALPRPFRSGCR